MVALRILGTVATLDNRQWTSPDPSVARILAGTCSRRPLTGYEPDIEMANARYAAERFKGRIIGWSARNNTPPADGGVE